MHMPRYSERGSAGGEMPTKQPQLAKLTRPRLHKAVARGLVSDGGARLRERPHEAPVKAHRT